eukprot:gene5797-5722_t
MSTLGTHPQTAYAGEPHFVLGTPLQGPWPDGLESVGIGEKVMGMWPGRGARDKELFPELSPPPDHAICRVPPAARIAAVATSGVFSTAVGYCNGTTKDPTYRQ